LVGFVKKKKSERSFWRRGRGSEPSQGCQKISELMERVTLDKPFQSQAPSFHQSSSSAHRENGGERYGGRE
jgi:hypothetical protein